MDLLFWIMGAAILAVIGFGLALEYRDKCRRSGLSAKERRQFRRMRGRREEFAYTIPLRDVIGDDEQEVGA